MAKKLINCKSGNFCSQINQKAAHFSSHNFTSSNWSNMSHTTEHLRTKGYAVLDVRPLLLILGGLSFVRDTVLHAWCNAPELKTPTTFPAVLGAFGASGLPSMFNAPILRSISCVLHPFVRSFLKPLANPGDYFAQRKDRACFRKKGTKQPKESWHKDLIAGAAQSDTNLAGWVNLGTSSNFLYCSPGTHTEQNASGDGFASVANPAACAANEKRVEVPPGFLLIFYPTLSHRVSDAPIKDPQGDLRIFAGWYIGQSSEPPYDVNKCMDEQSTFPLPSGADQKAPMHAKLHKVNHIDKLCEFSKLFKDTIIHIPKSGKNKGENFRVVPEVYPSPETPHFPPWTDSQRAPFIHTKFDDEPVTQAAKRRRGDSPDNAIIVE